MKDIIGSNVPPTERAVTCRKSKETISPNSNGYDNPRSARISHIPNSVNPSLTFSEEDEDTHRQNHDDLINETTNHLVVQESDTNFGGNGTQSSIDNQHHEFLEVLDHHTLTTTMHQQTEFNMNNTTTFQEQDLLDSNNHSHTFQLLYNRIEQDIA